MKILFVTAEAYPLAKTGGLADVCGSLPTALRALGHDVRIVLPGYPAAIDACRAASGRDFGETATGVLPGVCSPVRLLEGRFPGSGLPTILVEAPDLFDRPGGPYVDERGAPWPDNALRFVSFARVAATLALGRLSWSDADDWMPDVVHAHDWHSALAVALLARRLERPGLVFTIHNLAYQGLFPLETIEAVGLPRSWRSLHGLELHGRLCLIKAGIAFADRLTTVSPSYAREIVEPEMGCGLDGLLLHRRSRLSGILNGADYSAWDPARDRAIARTYSAATIERKRENKLAIQRRLGLSPGTERPLVAVVSRLAEQKGLDLVATGLGSLVSRGAQVAVVGTGDRDLARRLAAAAERHRGEAAVHLGYTEELAHLTTAGADALLMPSRFEPCGLSQLHALRYGTVPIVRRTGGLADTVVDATPDALSLDEATGFSFGPPTVGALLRAVERALDCYHRSPALWKRLAVSAMRRDFGWSRSARRYEEVYEAARASVPGPRRSERDEDRGPHQRRRRSRDERGDPGRRPHRSRAQLDRARRAAGICGADR